MSVSTQYVQLEESYWNASGGNIQTSSLISYNTTHYVLDPTTLNGLSANKLSVLTAGQLASFHSTFTAPNVVIPNASHFLQSNWNSFGWDVSSSENFAFDFANFIGLNFSANFIQTFNIAITYGTISGSSYAIPLFFEGNQTQATAFLRSGAGGTVTTDGNFKVHTFTSNGTFQFITGAGVCDFLVVAGGGGGQSASGGGGGGGGAGGLIYQTSQTLVNSSFPVVIGAGGLGSSNIAAGTGGNSSFNGQIAIGGGGGESGNGTNGATGGSGGGGGFQGTGATGTAGQGNSGGSGGGGQPPYVGGGGGGAGASGSNFSGNVGGNGGVGLSNSITGSAVFYAGGGGGGSGNDGFVGTPGTGGLGGGGNGGNTTADNGTAGANGKGGGGGGGQVGHAGGSGVVIVRYQYK